MIINRYREKLLNLIIYFVKNTNNCYKTKLFKLLYFADFLHFKETGKSMTSLHYKAWEKGPVPYELYGELKNPKADLKEHVGILGIDERVKFIPKKKFEEKFFTRRELNIIERISTIFQEADADLMIETTHLKNEPWHKTIKSKGQNAIIEYDLAFDDCLNSLSKEKYEEFLENNKFIKKIFS